MGFLLTTLACLIAVTGFYLVAVAIQLMIKGCING